MNISIFGLGYVGAVTAGCLARQGHRITGVDVQPQKVANFNRGAPPIIEPELDRLFHDANAAGLLRASEDTAEAIASTEVSIVCVGTPSTVTGAIDLSGVRSVTAEIATALRSTAKRHSLIFRSTMIPGSTSAIVAAELADLESSGRVPVFYHPEFLREGTAVADFERPSLSVVGTRTGAAPEAGLAGLFGAGATAVTWETAEMVKYACNAFHATKVAFANEIGRLGKELRIDSQAVMRLLCQDTRLNLSPYYLRPGNPFGGSCLPKDVRALIQLAREQAVSLPVLENILPSNERHLQALLQAITQGTEREVVILGLSFKPDTDDLRGSSMVEVARALLARDYQLRIYDPALNLAALVGANKRVIDAQMPHLAALLKPDLASAIGGRGVIVAAQPCATIAELANCVTAQHRVIDVNGWPGLKTLRARYEGFCW